MSAAPTFPRQHLGALHELSKRLLESRKVGTPLESLARDLLAGFHDTCMAWGLDRVLVELEQTSPPLDITDRSDLADHARLFPALVAQLGTIGLDGGGPRNAKPLQLADCVVAALGLELVDEPVQTTTLDGSVRAEVSAALAAVVDVALAAPQIREAIIAKARAQCDARHASSFDKLVANLDERGMKILRQPKIPLDAVHAVQRALFDARSAVIGSAASTAIDRAKQIIARVDADAAALIDQPITHTLTPRAVAITRAREDRVPKLPAAIVHSLLESLGDLARLAWREVERPARPYSASQTFAVGDLIEHPKFGRGSVVSRDARRIDVEFPDGAHTLAHVPPSK